MTAESFWSPSGPAMSAARVDWNTPQNIVDLVHEFFGGPPAVDPCSNPNSIVGANREYMLERGENGLTADWGATFFINPPYGKGVVEWTEKAWYRAMSGKGIGLGLMPARTDTKWGQRVLETASAVCFLRGRLTFVGASAPAPFPCMVPLWSRIDSDGHVPNFKAVFGDHGVVL